MLATNLLGASGRSGEPSDPNLTCADNPCVTVPVLGQLPIAFRIERRGRPRKTPSDCGNDAFRRRPDARTGLLISNELLPILVTFGFYGRALERYQYPFHRLT